MSNTSLRSSWRGNRRELFRRAGRLTAGAVALGSLADLLAACGGDDDSPATATVAPAVGTNPPAASATSTSGDAGASGAATPTSGSSAPSATAATGGSSSGETPVRGGHLRFGASENVAYGSLDMTTNTGTYDTGLPMVDAFTYLLPDNTFAPGLAESWEIGADGLSYTFKLRDDIVFHDGNPLDADAVKFNFDRILQSPQGLAYSYLIPKTSYDRCEVVDQYTVRHVLKTPNAIFMERLRRAFYSPQSPAAVQEEGEQYGKRPVSVGPFKLGEWVEEDHVRWDAFDQYAWGCAQIFKNTGRPYLDTLTHQFYRDKATKALAVESGEIDGATDLDPTDVVRFQDNPDYTLIVRTQLGTATLLKLNVERPPTDDIAVRKAMQFAIDREGLVQTVFLGMQDPAYHIFTPDLWSYDASLADMYSYDPDQAKQILDEAGWTAGSDGARAKNGQPLKLLWLLDKDTQAIGQFVQANLADVGIAVELQTLAGSGLVEAMTRGDHNIAEGRNIVVGADPDVLRNFIDATRIDVQQNYVRARNDELQKLLVDGITFPGDSHAPEREAIYQQAQKIIMEQAYVVPIYYQKYFDVYRSYIQVDGNLGYDPFGKYHYWNDVWMKK